MKVIVRFILLFLVATTLLQANTKDSKVEEMKQKVCKVLPTLDGWCSKEKALCLIDLVVSTAPAVCVDIGTYGGSSLFPVASALKYLGQGVVIGIDPWDKLECIKHFDPIENKTDLQWWGSLNLNNIYSSYLNMLRRFKLENFCITIKATSEKAATEIISIDILHIDGNHAEMMVKRDVELYLPKVSKGGYVLLNDSLWPTAQPAVELLSASCDVYRLIDNGNCIVFKKR